MQARMLVCALALMFAGCLEDEATHTVYLEPDGTALWSVSQTLVRSTSDKPDERDREESEFLTEAYQGKQAVAEGLRQLGAYGIETRVVRNHRPFTVTTEAHFTSLEVMLRKLLAQGDAAGDLSVETSGPTTRLNFVAVPRQETNSTADAGESSSALFQGERYRLVLSRGHFVSAQGFKLSGDGAIAVPIDLAPDGGAMTWELVWTLGD